MCEYSPSLVGLFGSLLSFVLIFFEPCRVTSPVSCSEFCHVLSVKSNDACADQRFTQHCDICSTGKQMFFQVLVSRRVAVALSCVHRVKVTVIANDAISSVPDGSLQVQSCSCGSFQAPQCLALYSSLGRTEAE